MSKGAGGGVPRILHLHSTFAAGGKEVRAARLMNAWGSRLDHAVVSAEPEAMGAAALIAPEVAVASPVTREKPSAMAHMAPSVRPP